jgi:uncharacterized protein YkwD
MRNLLVALLFGWCIPAWGTPVAVANAIRAQGCGGGPGIKTALQPDVALDAVARRLAAGGRLSDALRKADYRAEESFSLHVSNASTDAALARSLAQGFCSKVRDSRFQRIGVERAGSDVWLVLAKPFAVPGPGDAAPVNRRALELVNEARSRPRRCAGQSFPAAAKLRLHPLLERAAMAHAQDMAERGELRHEGHDGSSPAQRLARSGYRWRIVGENVAAGPPDIETAIAGWLGSPGHCANLMHPGFTEMGVGYAVNPRSQLLIYWTQDFADR